MVAMSLVILLGTPTCAVVSEEVGEPRPGWMQCLLYVHESIQTSASGRDLGRAKALSVMATKYVGQSDGLKAATLLAGAVAEQARKNRRAVANLTRRAAEHLRVCESHHQLVCALAAAHWEQGETTAYKSLLEAWRKRLTDPLFIDYAASVDKLLERTLKPVPVVPDIEPSSGVSKGSPDPVK
jgi:hypothetical protein